MNTIVLRLIVIILLGFFIPLSSMAGEAAIVIDPFDGYTLYDENQIAVFNNKLYFPAYTTFSGVELFEYDGGRPPRLVADLAPGSSSSSYPRNFCVFNNKLYFSTDFGIYAYDGVNTPTNITSSRADSFMEFNGKLYFPGTDGTYGKELWVYDGSNPPTIVEDIRPGSASSNPRGFCVYNDKLYFSAYLGSSYGIMVYDGVNPVALAANHNSSVQSHIIFNDKLYFLQYNGAGFFDLWSFDFLNPPERIGNNGPGTEMYSYHYPKGLVEFNNSLYFCAEDGVHGQELWSYDGINPPAMVQDLYNDSNILQTGSLLKSGGKLYFGISDWTNATMKLWTCDTSNSVSMVADLSLFNTEPYFIGNILEFNGGIYFSVGPTLWKYSDPALFLTYPDGGELLRVGTEKAITWTADASISHVNIDYSVDNGDTWNPLAVSAPNTGSYTFTVPGASSTQCLVKISDANGTSFDGSNTVFRIEYPLEITVTYPNGGEFVPPGTRVEILWTLANEIEDNAFNIEYSLDGGTTWTLINTDLEVKIWDEFLFWDTPTTESTTCLVRINEISGEASDTSDAFFRLEPPRDLFVIYPEYDAQWEVGTTQFITWGWTGNIIDVKIEYSYDNGQTWNTIAASTPNTGSYQWTIPDTPSDECKIRIIDLETGVISIDTTWFSIEDPNVMIPQSERDALIALYNSTNGDNWQTNTNWRKPGDPTQFNDPGTEGTWHGVSLNQNKDHVVTLNLNQNRLNGTLPDLSALTELWEIAFVYNDIGGTLPTWLNNLSRLNRILLSGNEFTGSIPDLSNLTLLDTLVLNGNNLTGSIPAWLNNLTNINNLQLISNQLSGPIPDLSNLTELNICMLLANQLTGPIPVWFNQLTKLTSLHLGSNQLSGTIPDLSNLTLLQYFSLSFNQLTGTVPAWISGFTGLLTLDLSNNQLQGTIPDLSTLTGLTTLKMTDNQFTGSIPAWLGNVTSLNSLYLENNRFSGTLPAELGNLFRVKLFNIEGNLLSGPIPSSLSHMGGLTVGGGLRMGWNKLYTDDTALSDFLNSRHADSPFETTQTITPTGLTISGETHDSVTVSWTPIQYQTEGGGYNVYYSTTAGNGYTLAGTTADKTVDNYTVTGLNSDTTYYFVVETVTDSHSNNSNTLTSEISTEVSTSTIEPPSITITSPNGGESWEAGTTHAVTWSYTGTITNVAIHYSIDSGSSWIPIIASTPNTGTYNWVIPGVDTSACLIKVSDTATTASDISDAVSGLWQQPSISVTSPNGGEVWQRATTQTITWTTTGTVGNVKIQYSKTGGSGWTTIKTTTPNTGTYQWNLPNLTNTQDDCLVRITEAGGTLTDSSDALFTIFREPKITVKNPNGGEVLVSNQTYTITWTNAGTMDFAMLDYSIDNGVTWLSIVPSTLDTGSYNWVVPDQGANFTECLVRVSDLTGIYSDVSNNTFTISAVQPSITVTSPNGGEVWLRGSTQTITWTSTGYIGDVKIQLSKSGGSGWSTIKTTAPNTGSYQWKLPNVTNTKDQCLIRVVAKSGSAEDSSDAVFTILKQ
ncbi:MAG: hypothetical protein GY940_10380 [bacterium]|nr:hypothetical protein [bacterium]